MTIKMITHVRMIVIRNKRISKNQDRGGHEHKHEMNMPWQRT